MAGFENPIVGGIALRIPAIRSPNYVAGSTGWTINIDGSVEFNNGTFRGTVTAGTFQGTDFVINTAGAFFYSAAPAAGNLIASIASVDSTDSFGNHYLHGVCSYDPIGGFFVQQADGIVSVGEIVAGVPDSNNAGLFLSTNGGRSEVASGLVGLNVNRVRFELFPGRNSQVSGAFTPQIILHDTIGSSQADLYLSGNVIKNDLTQAPYIWLPPNYNTNWGSSTTFNASTANQPFQYRLGIEDQLRVGGAFKAGAVAPGATVFNEVAPYRPKNAFWVNGWRNRGGTVTPMGFQWTPSGNFNVVATMGGGAPAANDEYWIPEQQFSLGNVP